jgi:Xaa-Pro dipeptidase
VTDVDYLSRREALRELLRAADLDAMLVTDLVNVRYLCGFTGSNGALVVDAGDDPGREAKTRFATDGRYTEQAGAEVPDLEHVIARNCAAALLSPSPGIRLGFESGHLTVDAHADLLDEAEHVGRGTQLVRAPSVVQRLRRVKDDAEIGVLRAACAAADGALADLISGGGLRPGRTEREVAFELEQRMRDHGAQGPSFDTIVAAGPHSAIPHHRPTDSVLAPGDLVKMDFGALLDGYHSDMTRTVVLGEPADWQRDLYQLVARAQASGRAALAVGAAIDEVDAAARAVIAGEGRGAEFTHPLGHGLGLEIHEAPILAASTEGSLEAGMAVTVEPGVYLAGRGGVRIEDTLVVRLSGPELLTLTSKDLLAL